MNAARRKPKESRKIQCVISLMLSRIIRAFNDIIYQLWLIVLSDNQPRAFFLREVSLNERGFEFLLSSAGTTFLFHVSNHMKKFLLFLHFDLLCRSSIDAKSFTAALRNFSLQMSFLFVNLLIV